MSSLVYTAKTKMAGMLQKLLRKLADTPASTEQAAQANTPTVTSAPSAEAHSIKIPPAGRGVHGNGKGVEVPLQPIIAGLALELQSRVKYQDAGALTLGVPLEKILAQLASGTVKISFGELRQAAPQLFTEASDRDSVLVSSRWPKSWPGSTPP